MAEAAAKCDTSPPRPKKLRTDDCSDAVDSTTDQGCVGDRDPAFLTTFQDFEVARVLNNDEEHKSVVVECHINGREGVAVVHLQVSQSVGFFLVLAFIYTLGFCILTSHFHNLQIWPLYPKSDTKTRKFDIQSMCHYLINCLLWAKKNGVIREQYLVSTSLEK